MKKGMVLLLVISLIGMSMMFANPLLGTEKTNNDVDPVLVGLVGVIIPGGGWFMLGDNARALRVLLIVVGGYVVLSVAAVILNYFLYPLGSVAGMCTLLLWVYGLYEAYLAYQEAVKRSGKDPLKEK